MYNGDHSVVFGPLNGSSGKNTWNDWYLIPTSRPTMAIPGTQNKFIEVQGMTGSIDATDYLITGPIYSDRSGNFEFLVDNDHANWVTIKKSIENYLHGNRLRMTLTDDPYWYYEGRFSFDEYRSDEKNSRVVISYRVAPYKISNRNVFAQDILWDPFYFETDIDWSVFYHIQSTTSAQSFYIQSPYTLVKLSVRLVSGSVTVVCRGSTAALTSPGQVVEFAESTPNERVLLTFTGQGVIDIGSRETSL